MFIKFCNILCIPLAEDKTVHPTQIITFLGIELDSIKMEARLPPEKLFSYSEEIKEALQMSKIKLRALKLGSSNTLLQWQRGVGLSCEECTI